MTNINSPIIRKYVLENRQAATSAEILMQAKLVYAGLSFTFQYPVMYKDSFCIVDFYVPSLGLLIEVDGGYHSESRQIAKDLERDKYLTGAGYNLLRLLNEDLDTFNTQTLFQFKRSIKILKEGESLPSRFIENQLIPNQKPKKVKQKYQDKKKPVTKNPYK